VGTEKSGSETSGTLGQFVGATIQRIVVIKGDHRAVPVMGLQLELRLADGSTRDLAAYTLSVGHAVHFRVDGMFVPPEELPAPVWLLEDNGIPRTRRGRVHWDESHTRPGEAQRVFEMSLPLWAQGLLGALRQDVTFCRRALEHRNARIKDLKARLRLMNRALWGAPRPKPAPEEDTTS
jgi:hypothetical protein